MKIFCLLFIFLSPLHAQQPTYKPTPRTAPQPAEIAAPVELTRLDKNLKPIKLKINKIENLNFAGACLSQPPCKGLLASRVKYPPKPKKVEEGPPREELLGHPAAQYCLQTGGRNIFLTDAKGNQYDYCLFEDESMVDSWGMYWKHH